MFLLDANILIALGDADHVHHQATQDFHEGNAMRAGWATCPLTENAFLRVFGHPNYLGGPGSPQSARPVLRSLTSTPGHQFWPDDLSLTDPKRFDSLAASGQLTDFYLLALAVQNGGRFATMDRRIDPAMVRGGAAAYHVLAHA